MFWRDNFAQLFRLFRYFDKYFNTLDTFFLESWETEVETSWNRRWSGVSTLSYISQQWLVWGYTTAMQILARLFFSQLSRAAFHNSVRSWHLANITLWPLFFTSIAQLPGILLEQQALFSTQQNVTTGHAFFLLFLPAIAPSADSHLSWLGFFRRDVRRFIDAMAEPKIWILYRISYFK